jgi:succinate dehydrogenase/fumarate reductase flavoprotein subunit
LNVGRHVLDGYRWSPDNSVEIERGWIVRADTPEELAERLGLPAEAVAESLRKYNAACAASEDTRFGRPADSLQPVAEPPFYAYRSGPMLAWTNGGPRRDEHARVLRPDGEPIPGLYAAGTASSTYSWGKDGGFHIADALLFGRIAAEHAVARGA